MNLTANPNFDKSVDAPSLETRWAQDNCPPVEPAVYRIVVKTLLPAEFANRVSGMNTTAIANCSPEPLTVLTGVLQGQKELMQVLHQLHEIRVSIHSVKCRGILRQNGE